MSDGVRLADLLAGLSVISDHGLGLPPDAAVRSCLVATALARKLDLGDGEVAVVFYDSLFEHIGCLGYAHESHLVWGDDVAANRAAQRTNFAAPTELFTGYLPTLLQDIEGWARAQVTARLFTKGPGFLKRFATASCEAAAQTARRLGLSQEVQLSLRHYSEWWNGKGVPAGVKGEEITLTARVVHVANVASRGSATGSRCHASGPRARLGQIAHNTEHTDGDPPARGRASRRLREPESWSATGEARPAPSAPQTGAVRRRWDLCCKRETSSRSRRSHMATGNRAGGNTGGIGLGGILVIVGIVLMIVWSFWLGLIIALVGLVAFGGFAKGKWY